jgi:hypothetical protein
MHFEVSGHHRSCQSNEGGGSDPFQTNQSDEKESEKIF